MAIPMRRCRVCRSRRPKAELVRWVASEGRLVKDEAQRQQARGCYSCPGACTNQIESKPERVKL